MTFTFKFLYMAHQFIMLWLIFMIGRDSGFITLCHGSTFLCLERVLKTLSGFQLSPLWEWNSPTMAFTGILVYMAHHFILLPLNPFGHRVHREGLWFDLSLSEMRVCLSREGAKNVSWPCISLLRGWGSLTITLIGKCVRRTHHFILLRLNNFGVRADR